MLNNITILNKKLLWQISNKPQRLCYIKLDQDILQLVIFTDFLFANIKDMLLQIGHVFSLVNATNNVNIIY